MVLGVSLKVFRFSCTSRFFITTIFVFGALFSLTPGPRAQAQVPVYTPPSVTPNDTLANVRYDYRWEVYGGFAYSHFKAGPNLVQPANLGGFDIQGVRWFRRHWALGGNARGYYGTSGVVPNTYGIRGPFVSYQMYMAGPEYRMFGNPHASVTLHSFFGGAHGNFDSALSGVPPQNLGLFSNQTAFGSAIGGALDLNRSSRLAFRIAPDLLLLGFGSQTQEQFGISVGIVYRLDQVHRKHR